MLTSLRIRDLALLERAELEFGPGFVAVTGETGAGKSVLLGALALLAGGRADRGLVRAGADAAVVEAVLHWPDPSRIDARLAELGLPACEEGQLLLHRTLPRSRAPRITVNGAITTLANLASLGEEWIDFHGPGEPQKLFQERWQLELLDRYGRHGELLAAYGAAWRAWRATLAEIERVRTTERLSAEELEFLKLQVARIDRAKLSAEGVESLERDWKRLDQSETLRARAAEVANALAGPRGAASILGPALAAARALAAADPEAAAVSSRLQSLIVEANDLASDCERLAEACDFDPATAERLRERMNLWQELRRRHGGDVAAILARREQLASRLALQGDIEGTLVRLEAQAAREEALARAEAGKLLRSRREAADSLARRAGELVNALGFRRARLRAEVREEPAPTEQGGSAVTLLFSANAGQEPQPLARIASSGETARVMLALKTVLADADSTPLLVFDEVDANIGGEIAAVVGRELAALGGRHQVVCVTHLAQVAACASQHLVVEKEQTADATVVTIAPLHGDREARVVELARMLGDRASAPARAHAAELLGGVPPPKARGRK